MSDTRFPDPGDDFDWVSALLADAGQPAMPAEVARQINQAIAVEWQLRHEDPARSGELDDDPLQEPSDDAAVPPLLPPLGTIDTDRHLAGLDGDD